MWDNYCSVCVIQLFGGFIGSPKSFVKIGEPFKQTLCTKNMQNKTLKTLGTTMYGSV